MAPENGSVLYSSQHNITRISFSHPSGNSFPAHLLQRLTDVLETVSADENTAVIILESEGQGPFCAGASFDELLAVANTEDGARFFSGFANVINAMRKCPKLIIGRVHGKAVGGGVGLAAACDYVLASDKAAVKLSELAIGIGPFVIAPAVERKIGKTGLAELALAPAEWKSAEWALEKGLYAGISPTEELDEKVDALAQNLSTYNPEALAEMKKVLWEGTDHWDTLLYERAAISGRLVLSEFTTQALQPFRK